MAAKNSIALTLNYRIPSLNQVVYSHWTKYRREKSRAMLQLCLSLQATAATHSMMTICAEGQKALSTALKSSASYLATMHQRSSYLSDKRK